jgi:intraflagellar transport protein 52
MAPGATPSARGGQPQQQAASSGFAPVDAAARVLFSCCKGETHTHDAGFKQLYRRLRSMYRPSKLDCAEDLCLEVLLGPGSSGLGRGVSNSMAGSSGAGASPAILVLGCPTQPFTAHEFDTLRTFLHSGGSLLVAMAEGGERAAGTNINFLLEELGIAVNADAVVRTAHYRYLHPKQALISDGVLNRAVAASSSSGSSSSSTTTAQADGGAGGTQADAGAGAAGSSGSSGSKGLEFVYPHGCTLSVQAPAVPILSSGKISYPMQRPLGEPEGVLVGTTGSAAQAGLLACREVTSCHACTTA